MEQQTNKTYLDKLYTDDKLDKFNQLHVVTSLFFKLCYYNITYPNAPTPPVVTRVREEHRCQQFCTAWGSSTVDSTGV